MTAFRDEMVAQIMSNPVGKTVYHLEGIAIALAIFHRRMYWVPKYYWVPDSKELER